MSTVTDEFLHECQELIDNFELVKNQHFEIKLLILPVIQESLILEKLSTKDMIHLRDFPYVWFQERIKDNKFSISDLNLPPYLSQIICVVHDTDQKQQLIKFIATNLAYNTQRMEILKSIILLKTTLNNPSVHDQLLRMSNDEMRILCLDLKLCCVGRVDLCDSYGISKIPRKDLISILCKLLPCDWNWTNPTDNEYSENIMNTHDVSLFENLYKEFKELVAVQTQKNILTKIKNFLTNLPESKEAMIKFLEMKYDDIPVNSRPMVKDLIPDMETDYLVDLCQRMINIQNARNM